MGTRSACGNLSACPSSFHAQAKRAALFCFLALSLTVCTQAQTGSGTFTYTGTLNTARYYHTATLLQNGKVLIAGGCAQGSNVYSSAELYDPSTGTFTYTGYMITARCHHTATLLQNGMVLIAGGVSETSILSSAELYNPSTGTFTATGSLNTKRIYNAATLLQNGKVLIAGGTTDGGTTVLASAELYDPSTGTFTLTGSMTTAREDHLWTLPSTLLNNGMVLIAGGYNGTSIVSSAELYNPSTGTFAATGSLNAPRLEHTAVLLQNGSVLVEGGDNLGGIMASAELYNPSTGTFTTTGSMTTARIYHTATLLENGTVLVAGGYVYNRGNIILSSAELYDPSTGTFAAIGSLNAARALHTAVLLQNGTVLIAGGEGGIGGPALSSAELYQQSPSITSSNNAIFNVGATGSFTVTASGYPAPSFSESGVLPSGVTFNPATGVLSGTPAAGSGANYSITFTASNGVGSNATQSFTLVVDQSAAITSANGATFALGTSPAFTVTVTGFPAPTLNEAGTLPSGVTFNPATGVLSGTPASGTAGSYPLTFTANNGVGSNATQSFTLTVLALPTISASVSPAPNSNGWVNMNATVTFTCNAGTLPIGSCPGPQTLSSDGAGQVVSGTVTDTAGNTASASVTINLDRAIPVLTVTSPADQSVESASPVTVSGTLTDALSGVSGVTCDGVTATLSGGAFSCNTSLTVGVNLVVVRGTDIAGNVAADNFHLSLTGTLPAPASLAVTPTGVNMVVGGTQQFTVVDDQGRPRPDATWSVDNTSTATIDTNSSPTLTAVAVGQANLTATVGSLTAQTQVNVLSGSGTSLPPGTVLWSAPPAPSGYTNSGFFQAQPIDDSGPDVFVMQRGNSGGTLMSAFANDGRQMWQVPTNDNLQRAGVPSPDGGQFAELQNSTTFGYYIAKIDGATGKQVWQYPLSTTTCCITQWAVGADGMLYMLEPQLDSSSNIFYPNLLGLDGATGTARLRIPLPNSSSQLTHSGCSDGQSDYNVSGPTGFFGPPEIAEDGSLRIELTAENISSTLTDVNNHGFCNHLSVQYSSQLQLWNVSSDGTYTTSVVKTLWGTVDCLSTTDNFSCPYHHAIPGEVIPDGGGGSLASWKDENNSPPGYSTWSPEVFHVSDAASSGTSDSTLSALQPSRGYYSWIPMVLGENNTVFATDGKNIAAFSGGSTVWTYAAASGNTPSLIVSAQGGGLAAKTTSGGVDTVRRFDPSGTLTTDSWTGSNLDFYVDNTYFGSASSGSGSPLIAHYAAESVSIGGVAWFAQQAGGNNQATQDVVVSGFSANPQDPNEIIIASVLQKIQTALPSYNSCNNWLQGAGKNAGTSASQLIPAILASGDFGHGVFNTSTTAAFSGGVNLSGNPTNIPSTAALTVNDIGGFFNQTDSAGHQFHYGPRNYAGNSLRAQASILLHEFGHILTVGAGSLQPFPLNAFGYDVNRPKVEKINNKLVDHYCRQLIEGLQ